MTGKNFTIRRARGAAALLPLMAALKEHLGEEVAEITADTVARDLLAPGGAHTVLVAERASALVGYALAHETWDSARGARGLYMADLFVAEAARRQGAARALVAALAGAARGGGGALVWWLSETWDEAAHGFYAALGATHDPLIAHTLDGAEFDRLAKGGGRMTPSPPPSPPRRRGPKRDNRHTPSLAVPVAVGSRLRGNDDGVQAAACPEQRGTLEESHD